jgi:hypothetical protein
VGSLVELRAPPVIGLAPAPRRLTPYALEP